MSAAKAKDTHEKHNWTLAGSSWEGAWKIFAGIGVLGLAGAGAGFATDVRRFAFSWMFAFVTVLAITLGSLFFVLIQRLTSAGWSVTVRRTAEYFTLGFIPLAVQNSLDQDVRQTVSVTVRGNAASHGEYVRTAIGGQHLTLGDGTLPADAIGDAQGFSQRFQYLKLAAAP